VSFKIVSAVKLTKKEQIKAVQQLLDSTNIITNNSKVNDIYIYYWNDGVHIYKPFGSVSMKDTLKKLKNPIKGIKVIGEIVSTKQGWVEGAIQSVK